MKSIGLPDDASDLPLSFWILASVWILLALALVVQILYACIAPTWFWWQKRKREEAKADRELRLEQGSTKIKVAEAVEPWYHRHSVAADCIRLDELPRRVPEGGL